MKRSSFLLLVCCALVPCSCIQDEKSNTECDIESVSLHIESPTDFFYHDYDTMQIVISSASDITFTTRSYAEVGMVPVTLRTTSGATVYRVTENGEEPFLNGMNIDFSDEQVQTFRVVSENKAWSRSYNVTVLRDKPSEGNISMDFEDYELDPSGKYYVWQGPEVFTDGQWKNGNPGFKISLSLAIRAIYAIYFGDIFDICIGDRPGLKKKPAPDLLLAVMEALKDRERNYGLRFVFCGSEERGLLGSKAYVAAHEEELPKVALNINLDMIGTYMGRFIARVSAEDGLVQYIRYFAQIRGFGIKTSMGVYSSDSTPFADKGVPALSFARLAGGNMAPIHNRYDTPAVLSDKQILEDCAFITAFTKEMADAVKCPVKREIPEKVRKELDEYLGRKRRED